MKDRLFFGNTYCAVEHSFDTDGKEEFHFLQLRKKKSELIIVEAKSFNSFEILLEYLNDKNHDNLVLVINNNQLLLKFIPVVESNKEIVFKSAYPTLTRSDFHSQIEYSKSKSVISIVRKDYLNKVIKEYTQSKIDVLDVFLGNLSITSFVEFLDNNEFYSSNSRISISDSTINEIILKQFRDDFYTINGLKIQNKYLLSFGAIVGFYLKNSIQYSDEYFQNFKEKKKFTIGYKLGLGVVFMLVLTNFLFFNNYNNKVNNLRQELELKEGVRNKFSELSKRLVKKRKLLSELTNSSLNSVSKFTDQIVLNIPQSIVLKEVNYQPLRGTIKKNKEVQFLVNEIEVKGILNSYDDFSRWIDDLEGKDWVLQLLDLVTEKEKRKVGSSFHVLIRIK